MVDNKKLSILVVGSNGHKLAECCVAWGETFYVPDYDVVIFDMTSLTEPIFQEILVQSPKYFSGICENILEAQEKRETEIICIMNKQFSVGEYSREKVSNYSWCPVIPAFEEKPGNKINNDKTSNKLRYFGKIKNWERLYIGVINNSHHQYDKRESGLYFKTYLTKLVVNQIENAIAFAVNWRVHQHSDYSTVVHGAPITFIPAIQDLSLGIDSILEDLTLEEEPVPDWISSVILPGENTVLGQIQDIDNQIKDLLGRKDNQQLLIQESSEYKKLLYSKGMVLENIVEKAFSYLGIKLESPVVTNEEDRFFNDGSNTIRIEIRGKNSEGLNGKDLNQLIVRLPERPNPEYKVLGMFVLNHHKNTEPSKRPKPFEDNLVKKAIALDICLLSSDTLFDLVNRRMAGEEFPKLKEAMFNCRGIFTADYYKESQLSLEFPKETEEV